MHSVCPCGGLRVRGVSTTLQPMSVVRGELGNIIVVNITTWRKTLERDKITLFLGIYIQYVNMVVLNGNL